MSYIRQNIKSNIKKKLTFIAIVNGFSSPSKKLSGVSSFLMSSNVLVSVLTNFNNSLSVFISNYRKINV